METISLKGKVLIIFRWFKQRKQNQCYHTVYFIVLCIPVCADYINIFIKTHIF